MKTIFVLGLAFCFLIPFIAMHLWNYAMPQVFGVGEITYWQMMSILILGRMIFGNNSFYKNKE